MTNSIATRRKYANSTIGKLKHENQLLRTEVERLKAAFHVRNETANKYALEIERLRAALRVIADVEGDRPNVDIAREALGDE